MPLAVVSLADELSAFDWLLPIVAPVLRTERKSAKREIGVSIQTSDKRRRFDTKIRGTM